MNTQNVKNYYCFESMHDEDCNEYITKYVAKNDFDCKVHFQ